MNQYLRSMEVIEADDLFAGPGGWDFAAEKLRIHSEGFELDESARKTRQAAGLRTAGDDVTKYGPRWRTVAKKHRRLLIGSPPCQTFSASGNGSGRRDLQVVLDMLEELCMFGTIRYDQFEDMRTGLVLEPMRWAIEAYNAGEPYDAIVLEQVPSVLPVWEAYGERLRELGYSVWVGKLHAEEYGVPQTRIRAVLIAKLHGEAKQPEPTHSRYYPRSPEKLDEGVRRWVTMAEALGWGLDGRPSPTITGGGTKAGGAEPIAHLKRYSADPSWVRPVALRSNYGTNGNAQNRGERTIDQPAATITGKSRNNEWVMGDVRQANGTIRNAEQSAPTITASADNGNFRWVHERPATTVQGDPRLGAPGHKHMGAGCCAANPDGDVNESQFEKKESVRLSLEECAALQTFPADYPWQGTKQKKHEQVGNAVPPRLAYHILKEALR